MTVWGFRRVTQTSISKDVLIFREAVKNVGVTWKFVLMKETKNRDSVNRISEQMSNYISFKTKDCITF